MTGSQNDARKNNSYAQCALRSSADRVGYVQKFHHLKI